MSTQREAIDNHTAIDDLEPIEDDCPYRRAAVRWMAVFRPMLDVLEGVDRGLIPIHRIFIYNAFRDVRLAIENDSDFIVAEKEHGKTLCSGIASATEDAKDDISQNGESIKDCNLLAIRNAYCFAYSILHFLERANSIPLACAAIRHVCSWTDKGMRQTAGALGVTPAAISLEANKFRREAGLTEGMGMKPEAARDSYSRVQRQKHSKTK